MLSPTKQYCFDSGMVDLFRKVDASIRIHQYNSLHGTSIVAPYSIDEAELYYKNYFVDDDIRCELHKIICNEYQKTRRIDKRVKTMLEYPCLFLTLTFDDKHLLGTKEDTRRQRVRRWLDNNSVCYVANIDYGDKNGREHYHAVVIPYDNIDLKSFGYGYVQMQHVYNKNDKAISKYMNKLTHHAIKQSNKSRKVIYSRLDKFVKWLCLKVN